MNFGKILDLIANENIDQSELFNLIDNVRTLDLNNENNLREVIKKVSRIANKPIDRHQEEELVRRIKQNGVPEDLFSLFK